MPELAHLPGRRAHEPWKSDVGYENDYPLRIVDHAEERKEALERYQACVAERSRQTRPIGRRTGYLHSSDRALHHPVIFPLQSCAVLPTRPPGPGRWVITLWATTERSALPSDAPRQRLSPCSGKRRATTPPRRSPVRPPLPAPRGRRHRPGDLRRWRRHRRRRRRLRARLAPARAARGHAAIGSAAGQALARRGAVVSRDYTRDAGDEETDPELIALAEKQMAEQAAKLEQMRKAAEKQAAKIKENKWVLPLASYGITATFGQYGLWSSFHTGLDFNGDSGDPIRAVANGTVTETGYDGAYGNKTVVTLDDGTEIWFCHQTSIFVSVGDSVHGGEVIGTVGATGNVTGSHLHLEVRPGGGDPVDPFQAFVEHGVVP